MPSTPAWSIDIGLVDSATGLYYLADKTNNGVDVVDANALTFLGTITGTGVNAFKGNTTVSATSGPNGLTQVGPTKLYASDGNSTVKVIDLTSRTVVKTIALGGTSRADEGSYDPDDHIALIDSDADSPVFQTFIDTTTDTVIGKLKRADATAGMEASIYISSLHAFVQAVPATKTNKNGEIELIDPIARAVTTVFPMPAKCGPTGIALGPDSELVVAGGGDETRVAPGAERTRRTLARDGGDFALDPSPGGMVLYASRSRVARPSPDAYGRSGFFSNSGDCFGVFAFLFFLESLS